MKTFTIISMFFVSLAAISQIAPVLGSMHRAEEARAQHVAYDVQQNTNMVKACSEGKTSVIMYNGKMCNKD